MTIMTHSIEVDHTNPSALLHCLQRLEKGIPDYENWKIRIDTGGIDCGIYLNIDAEEKIIEISNQGNGEDYIDDLLEELNDDDDDEE